MTQPEKLLSIARAEIGTAENPMGSNNVAYNTTYYGKSVRAPANDPAKYAWCMSFVWWCFYKVGLSALFYDGKKTAYCPTFHNWAKAKGLVVGKTQGKPGDIILFDWQPNGKADHVGIIEKVIPGGYQTIEGNWDNAVERVTRTRPSEILAIIRPKWTDAAPAKAGAAEYADYTVQPGDTLYEIAKRKLGKGSRWPEIRLRDGSKPDPKKIWAGMQLRIPKK